MDAIKHTLISMEAVTLGLRSQDLGDFNVQSMIIKQLGRSVKVRIAGVAETSPKLASGNKTATIVEH
ncbi:hypothetical protein PENDEC_c025G04452 [Penicillium decumbens]|uniref:Uncharacterized protein n=1 Tax=Penicillium decumbens TaxID=69771 RepID=A0A1V6NZV7_PENDC|nr:hypothetical protein PENDEC_c025G04452 [Penicillium decumbens]